MKVTQVSVYEFLSQRSLAVVGVSRTGKKMGNAIYRALREKGYKVFQVHREADSVEGDPCYRTIGSLPEKVGGVVICVPPVQTEEILRQAFEAGIKHVWMQRGSESYAAVRYLRKERYASCVWAVHHHVYRARRIIPQVSSMGLETRGEVSIGGEVAIPARALSLT